MSSTRDRAQVEISKFLTRRPSLPRGYLGGSEEESSFSRVRETVLMGVGTRPEVLFYLRHLGRNKLLAHLRSVVDEGSRLILYLDAATKPSRGSADASLLTAARRSLRSAALASITGSASSSAGSIKSYRKNLASFARGVAPDGSAPVGREARSLAHEALETFIPLYLGFMADYASLSTGVGTYSPDTMRVTLSQGVIDRADQSLRLAGEFIGQSDEEKVQSRSSDYTANVTAASAALRMVEYFRSPFQPLVRSGGGGALPTNTELLLSADGPATPSEVVGTKAPGILTPGDALLLSVDGGPSQTVAIAGAGLYSLTSAETSLALSSKSLFFQSGGQHVIPLTNNPPDLDTVISDINTVLAPLGGHALSLDGRTITLTHGSPFYLETQVGSGAEDLGFKEGVLAHPETTASDLADQINAEVAGVVATTEDVRIGSPDEPLGTGTFTTPNQFDADTDLTVAGVQVGDYLVAGETKSLVTGLSGQSATIDSAAPLDSREYDFYAISPRVTLVSESLSRESALEILNAPGDALPLGLNRAAASGIKLRGKDGTNPTSSAAILGLYGVAAGDIVDAREDNNEYRMEVSSVVEDLALLVPVGGWAPIPASSDGLEFEINAPMRTKSRDLTLQCRRYAVSRRGAPLSTRSSVERLRVDVGVASGSGQLKAMTKSTIRSIASLIYSLSSDITDADQVEAVLAAWSITLPPAGVVLEDVLLSYTDSSPEDVVARGKAVLRSMEERGYDRARDLLLLGKVRDFAQLSSSDATYAGKVLLETRKIGSELTRT